jgi:hypothetical protein
MIIWAVFHLNVLMFGAVRDDTFGIVQFLSFIELLFEIPTVILSIIWLIFIRREDKE